MLFSGLNICPRCLRIITTTRQLYHVTKLQHSAAVTVQLRRMSSSKQNALPDLQNFPAERIRNFSIIAHVDHGKSTLADRLLEITGTISKDEKNEQVLDKLQVERERGITVKAQTASLIYQHKNENYLLNLVDTPGHVDFNYEVSRALAACQGVILLVDASQGIQAQTVANFYLAFESELSIVPVINKIDLKTAKPEEVAKQMKTVFALDESEIIKVSAKLGTGIEAVLQAVVENIPPPPFRRDEALKMLLFDSTYNTFRGVVNSVAVMNGVVRKGDIIKSVSSSKTYEVQEVGIMYPEEMSSDVLYAGQVGYIHSNMRNAREAHIGDTFHHENHPVEPHAGVKDAVPMVYAGLFPAHPGEFDALKSSLEKLLLNDASVQVNKDSSAVLGQGWRLGFLGLLHMDVFTQRLEQEFDAAVIITSPNVPYKVSITGAKNIKQYGGEELTILNPCLLPKENIITQYKEPMVLATIITPDEHLSTIMKLIAERRGESREQSYIDDNRLLFKVVFPLGEVVVDFFDELKSVTKGYASFDYEDHGYQETILKKIEIALNGKVVDELTQLVHVSKVREMSRHMVTRLKDLIPPQLFLIAIQAKMGNKVMARENIKALRKDVLAKCYGGDVTRKMKLLKQQAEGKRRMRLIGKVSVPREAFIRVLSRT